MSLTKKKKLKKRKNIKEEDIKNEKTKETALKPVNYIKNKKDNNHGACF